MTSAEFKHWLKAMKAAGLAKSDAECGRLMGRSANSIVNMKQQGADEVVGIACRGLFHRMTAWKIDQ